MIVDIKPLGFPVTNLTTRSIWNVPPHHLKMKLNIGTTNCGNIPEVRMRIQKEYTLKEIEVGVDSKENLAQVNKNSNMEN
jgi:hypothetical protein